MIRKPAFAVLVISFILLIYCILIGFNVSLPAVYLIFAISPFLLGWLAYTIIRFGVFQGEELNVDEEWGYQDRNKEDLDMF